MSTYDYKRKRNDDAQPFKFTPQYSDGTTPNLSGASVKFIMRASAAASGSTPKVNAAGTIVNNERFEYAPVPADVDTAGLYYAEWQVTYANAKKETWPLEGTDPKAPSPPYLLVYFYEDLA